MKTKFKQAISAIMLILFLVGCSAVNAGDQTAQSTSTPLPEPKPAETTVEPGGDPAQILVNRAIADLAYRQMGNGAEIAVQEVIPTDFSDASLGVPEPGKMYAQMLTPGYVIRLAVGDQVYIYHGSGERVVLAAQETTKVIAVPGDPSAPTVPVDQPAPPASGQAEYSRVEVADTGLSIDVPAGWLRLEPEWKWTPAEGSDLILGVNWVDLQPPQEAEPALLPAPSQTLTSEKVMLGWGSGRRFLLEVYGPTAQGSNEKAPVQSVELHVLITVNQEGLRRAFDLYVKGGSMEDMGSLDPVLQHTLETSVLFGVSSQVPVPQGLALVGEDPATGWPTLQDESYGYQIALPNDWAWKELPARGPGIPDDWPVMRIVHLYPQAWDKEINRSGPPDPNAKSVVAPLQIEVVSGSAEQLRRVYPEPAQSETIKVNSLPVVVEKEIYGEMTLTRYVLTNPTDPELWVVISDQMTGFADRVEGNEAIAALVPQIVSSLRLSDLDN